jgi:hypothetical protein
MPFGFFLITLVATPFLPAMAARPFFLTGAAVVVLVGLAAAGLVAGFAAGFAAAGFTAGFPLGAALDFLRGGEDVASFFAVAAVAALVLLGWGGLAVAFSGRVWGWG